MSVLPGGEQGAGTSAGRGDETVSRTTKAQVLKAEWERLREEHDALQQETDRYRLSAGSDPAAIRSHHQRIRNHQARLSAWSALLERFRARYGEVGLELP